MYAILDRKLTIKFHSQKLRYGLLLLPIKYKAFLIALYSLVRKWYYWLSLLYNYFLKKFITKSREIKAWKWDIYEIKEWQTGDNAHETLCLKINNFIFCIAIKISSGVIY